MGSEILWKTDLGLVKVGSGELSPGLDPIELRFYPQYGWGFGEWDIEVGVLEGEYPLKFIFKEIFIEGENYFKLIIRFKKLTTKSKICFIAKHIPTNLKQTIWEGEILPNVYEIQTNALGLQNQNWDVLEHLKKEYPNFNPNYFPTSEIKVIVKKYTIIAAQAKSVEEHVVDNCPVVFKGFHPKQKFNLEVYGHLLGHGGMGGNAGISTVSDEIDIVYPTDGQNGGDVVYVEHETQSLDILVHHGATYLPGRGGKGASAFLINCPEKRINQIGQPGLGGFPNGLNGKFTDIHYRLKLIKENTNPNIKLVNKHDYYFESGKIAAHDQPFFIPANKSVSKSKDGKNGNYAPKGVTKLTNYGGALELNQLVYIYGGYMSI